MPDVEKYINLITQYWWAFMAIASSHFMAFAFVQRYKAARRKKGLQPSALFFGNLAGVMTFVLTTGFWFKYNGDLESALYMGLTIGILQPFIVAWIMTKLKEKMPEVYEEVPDKTEWLKQHTKGNDK